MVRQKIDRQNNFKQAGERWCPHEDWEKEDLVNNLASALAPAKQHIQDTMVELFTQCDEEYGRRVKEAIGRVKTEMGGKAANGQMNPQAQGEATAQAEGVANEAKPY